MMLNMKSSFSDTFREKKITSMNSNLKDGWKHSMITEFRDITNCKLKFKLLKIKKMKE